MKCLVQADAEVGEERGLQEVGHKDPDGGDGRAPPGQPTGPVRTLALNTYFLSSEPLESFHNPLVPTFTIRKCFHRRPNIAVDN